MSVTVIVDPDDPRVGDYRDLTGAAFRRAAVAEERFIAEGVEVVRRLLRSDHEVRSVLATPDRHAELGPDLAASPAPVLVVDREVLNAIVGFNLHRRVVASARRRPPRPVAGLAAGSGPVAVLEGVNDHENLGAVFRSAAALGIRAVLLDPTSCDPYYRRSVRVSMGGVLTVPFARAARWPDDLAGLGGAGFRLVALTPDPAAVPLAGVVPGERDALLLGAEGPGLSAAARAVADLMVRIPMTPGTDSLNVGHAAAIAFHHFGSVRG